MADLNTTNAADRAYMRTQLGVGAKAPRFVSNKTGPAGGMATTNKTTNAVTGDATTLRRSLRLPSDRIVSSLQWKFSNWRLAPAETAGDNDITIVKVALEYAGTFYPVFFNGKRSVTIEPNGEVLSDPISPRIPAGAQVFLRYRVSVPTGGTMPTGRGTNINVGDFWNGKDGPDIVDATGTAGFSADSSYYAYGPSAMIGLDQTGSKPAIFLVGDSIAAGATETSLSADGDIGFLERGLSGRYPWCAATRGNQAFVTIAGNPTKQMTLAAYASSALTNLGVNDFYNPGIATSNSPNLDVVQARALALWSQLSEAGCRVYQTTVTPVTSSTDKWATTANQTIYWPLQNAKRTAFNDWLRAGAPIVAGVAVAAGTQGALLAGQAGHPLTDYIEIADIVETARNSGIWKVTGAENGYTADGTHPTSAMHALMSAPIATFDFA